MKKKFKLADTMDSLTDILASLEENTFDVRALGINIVPLVRVIPIGLGISSVKNNSSSELVPWFNGNRIGPHIDDIDICGEPIPGGMYSTQLVFKLVTRDPGLRAVLPLYSTQHVFFTCGTPTLLNNGWRELHIGSDLDIVPSDTFMRQLCGRAYISSDFVSHNSPATLALLLSNFFTERADDSFYIRLLYHRKVADNLHASKLVGRAFFTKNYTVLNNAELFDSLADTITDAGCHPMWVDYDMDILHAMFTSIHGETLRSSTVAVGFSITNSETGASSLYVRPSINVTNKYIEEHGKKHVELLLKENKKLAVKLRHLHNSKEKLIDAAKTSIVDAVKSAMDITDRVKELSKIRVDAESAREIIKNLAKKYHLTNLEREKVRDYHENVDGSALGMCVSLAFIASQTHSQARSLELSSAGGDMLTTDGLF